MTAFDGEMYDGEGRMTFAYARFLREQDKAREARDAEARGDVDAKKIVDDMNAWDYGYDRPGYRDEIAEIVAAVEAREKEERQ